jgi:hypothetical protein
MDLFSVIFSAVLSRAKNTNSKSLNVSEPVRWQRSVTNLRLLRAQNALAAATHRSLLKNVREQWMPQRIAAIVGKTARVDLQD